MEKEIRIYTTEVRGKFAGQVKFDGFRKRFHWTALGVDGSRLADVETREEAEILIFREFKKNEEN